MSKSFKVTVLILMALLFVICYLNFTPFGVTKTLLLETDHQKQMIKDILNKQIGFELSEECDLNTVVTIYGKDKLIFIKGFVNNSELIPVNSNTEYRKSFCDKGERAFSLFDDLANGRFVIDKACMYEKECGDDVKIILAPSNSANGYIIYFCIVDNKFSLANL